ncbi:MAG: AbrB/MazE/SpoVT family DNA-binding domain-containing protein, partial [Candidatus Woesearchaeota archaeon]|nr:AbrB/MazE/SpoVT family DNA-binding domain-containing protein [Candidatus Woesearchaeota archaeon]
MVSIRKLVKAGPASHTISLPKDWLEQHGLKTGDSLYVEEKPDSLVIKTEAGTVAVAEHECNIALENKSDSSVQRELSAAYVNNNRTIRFSGKSAESRLPAIRTMLQGFVALEITEQTPSVLVVRDLLDLEEISVEKTMRRMEMMVRTMLSECCNSDVQEQLRVKDEEVNKLYFLLIRLVRSVLSVPGMGERFSLTAVKASQLWFLVTYVEDLGDYAQAVHVSFARLPKERNKSVKELVFQL